MRIVRPKILWHPTLAALDRFDLGESIRGEASVKLSEIDIGGLMTLRPAHFSAAGAEAFSADPLPTRQLIVAAAEATGHVEVLWGVAVASRLSEGGQTCGVAGHRCDERVEVGADLFVGDHGVQSFVRGSLGIAIDLRVFPMDWITAAVRWPASIPVGRTTVFLNVKNFQAGIPAVGLILWPAQQGVLLIRLPPARAQALIAQTPTEFLDLLAKTMPLAEEFRGYVQFPKDFVRVTRPFGHAASYGSDGAALVGDAAHPMSTAGGQGANASILDALALAEVADEATFGQGHPHAASALRTSATNDQQPVCRHLADSTHRVSFRWPSAIVRHTAVGTENARAVCLDETNNPAKILQYVCRWRGRLFSRSLHAQGWTCAGAVAHGAQYLREDHRNEG